MYQLVKDLNGVLRVSDGAFIPNDERNSDWRIYQSWVTAGGQPLAAVAEPTPQEIVEHERGEGIAELLTGTSGAAKLVRGILLVALDEINLLRQRDRDRSVDVAAATSLADLKTRWAARASLADRTGAQLKNAVENKIDAGSAD